MSESHFWVGLRYVAVHLNGGADRSRILDMDFWTNAGGETAWADLHSRELRPEQVQNLKKCTYAGRPFGEESFVEEMQTRFQRQWIRKAKVALTMAS